MSCVLLCVHVLSASMCLRLTRHGAAEDLQPHTQSAVPALRDDSDVAGQHGLCQLIHDRNILIIASKEQLDKRGRKVSQGLSQTWCPEEVISAKFTQSAYPSWMVVHSLLSLLKARKYDVTKSLLKQDKT